MDKLGKGSSGQETRQSRNLLSFPSSSTLSRRGKAQLVANSKRAKVKPFWKTWTRKKGSKVELSSHTDKLRAIYGTELSLVTALVVCFVMAILLMIVKEVGQTARYCIKWDFWTILVTGKRNSVVSIVQSACYKIWEAS
ncbi:LADA_0E10550g1_1 [Lachancea dasiensis]|uniref:LADA_0E10550g1_1 n=1 Tax=Lachancea dasiensis TaxID=1072105 RepID=A0A1G4JE66_9SACH|nr:LADA_0E10550g1_1 [Lachancea dasiensis]